MNSPLKYHGGKHYLAPQYLPYIPENYIHYAEHYCGGASMLFKLNPERHSECINDIDGRPMNFWRVLAEPSQFEQMKRHLEAVPFSSVAWDDAWDMVCRTFPVMSAVGYFILCRQSMAGRMDSFAPLTRNRTRRGMNEQASAWLGSIEGLPAVHARLKRVAVLCAPALTTIAQQDGKNTFHFLDPTYLPSTRAAKEVYQYEMSESDHIDLLQLLEQVEGKFMLCGYDSELYQDYEKRNKWKRNEFYINNNSASGKTKEMKKEVIWRNYTVAADSEQLFGSLVDAVAASLNVNPVTGLPVSLCNGF